MNHFVCTLFFDFTLIDTFEVFEGFFFLPQAISNTVIVQISREINFEHSIFYDFLRGLFLRIRSGTVLKMSQKDESNYN